MVIEADTAEELRAHILLFLVRREETYRLQFPCCRSIGERRALNAAALACHEMREDVEAMVIKPKCSQKISEAAKQ